MGHVISSAIGVGVSQLISAKILAAPVSVGLSVMAMLLTKSVHPPAGGSALIAAISPEVQTMGFEFVVPCCLGSTVLVVAGLLNNLFKVKYPVSWYK